MLSNKKLFGYLLMSQLLSLALLLVKKTVMFPVVDVFGLIVRFSQAVKLGFSVMQFALILHFISNFITVTAYRKMGRVFVIFLCSTILVLFLAKINVRAMLSLHQLNMWVVNWVNLGFGLMLAYFIVRIKGLQVVEINEENEARTVKPKLALPLNNVYLAMFIFLVVLTLMVLKLWITSAIVFLVFGIILSSVSADFIHRFKLSVRGVEHTLYHLSWVFGIVGFITEFLASFLFFFTGLFIAMTYTDYSESESNINSPLMIGLCIFSSISTLALYLLIDVF